MSKELIEEIEQQKNEVFNQDSTVNLKSACTVGSGIIKLSKREEVEVNALYSNYSGEIQFFIPASGSGSRMFQFLINYLENDLESVELNEFISKIESFAFYNRLDYNIQRKLKSLSRKELANYLLAEKGLNFANTPKGLVPFHETDKGILNAYQEQVLQLLYLLPNGGNIEFTVQQEYEKEIASSLKELNAFGVNVSFSYQNKESDAYCFTNDGELFIDEDGKSLRRPAGHGALLENLNSINSDIILIKNIDNVQHKEKSQLTANTWKATIGLLLAFQKELKELYENFDFVKLKKFNDAFQLFTNDDLININEIEIGEMLRKPSRVCGMVKNEGAPGGGPFWMSEQGVNNKQIVEKVQINQETRQQQILDGSSHFNPVFIALTPKDCFGNKLDLLKFRDLTKCLVVNKMHNGCEVIYRELPGLWNGSMSNWNTLFLEIPSEVFSPVKSVLDLLNPEHKL